MYLTSGVLFVSTRYLILGCSFYWCCVVGVCIFLVCVLCVFVVVFVFRRVQNDIVYYEGNPTFCIY